MPLLLAPVIRTNVDLQIEIVPADGHQAAIFRERRPRNVAVFGQLSVKVNCLTTCQPTTFPAHTKGPQESLGDRVWPTYVLQCGSPEVAQGRLHRVGLESVRLPGFSGRRRTNGVNGSLAMYQSPFADFDSVGSGSRAPDRRRQKRVRCPPRDRHQLAHRSNYALVRDLISVAPVHGRGDRHETFGGSRRSFLVRISATSEKLSSVGPMLRNQKSDGGSKATPCRAGVGDTQP